ncbi:hypothetical protein DXA40_09140 [Blautia sp. OF01-4LB]|nr:hypothetical protein DXA40_09140 [Blautia sp. OF01-4LB]
MFKFLFLNLFCWLKGRGMQGSGAGAWVERDNLPGSIIAWMGKNEQPSYLLLSDTTVVLMICVIQFFYSFLFLSIDKKSGMNTVILFFPYSSILPFNLLIPYL